MMDAVFAEVLGGGAIADGTRNCTLTGIAGRLHDGTRGLEQLAADLMGVNEARCRPPLPHDEVRGIARSIHKRAPCRKHHAGDVGEAVRAALALYGGELGLYEWCGKGSYTDRSIIYALVRHAMKFGVLIPSGVRVSIGLRQLSLEAGISLRTARLGVKRLRRAGYQPRRCGQPWLSRDDRERAPQEAGSLVLRVAGNIPARKYHTYPQIESGWIGVELARARSEADVSDAEMNNFLDWAEKLPKAALDFVPALRWGRIGKKAEMVLFALVEMRGVATVAEIAQIIGDKRPRDLLRDTPTRTGALVRLRQHGIIEIRGEGGGASVELSPTWSRDLEFAREATGERAAAEADEREYKRQREAFAEELARIRHERESAATRSSAALSAAPYVPFADGATSFAAVVDRYRALRAERRKKRLKREEQERNRQDVA